MAQTNLSTLEGFFTEAYGSTYVNLPNDFAIITNAKKLELANRVGNKYNFPVILSMEQGLTLNTDGTAFTLNDAASLESQNAEVQAASSLIRGQIANAVIARIGGGKKQFVSEVGPMIKLSSKSMAFHLELSKLYGQSGLCVTTATTGLTATTLSFTVSAGTWSAATWTNAKNMSVDFWSANTGSGDTLLNTVGPMIVQSVAVATRVVTVSGAAADVTAINADETCTVFRYGAKTGDTTFTEPVGILKMASNAGSLFGIDAASYSLWLGNSVSVGANLTLSSVQDGCALLAAYGVTGKLDLYVSPKTWRFLLTEMTALRRFDESASSVKYENGTQKIQFYSQTGVVEVISHPLVREGEAFLLKLDELHRIGSMEPAYKMNADDPYIQRLSDKAGVEYRIFADEALICEAPSHMVVFTGITNA